MTSQDFEKALAYWGPRYTANPKDKATELNSELSNLLSSRNTAGLESLVVPSEYLEVVITLP